MPDPGNLYFVCARLNIALAALALISPQKGWAYLCWTLSGLCWALQTAAHFYSAGITALSGIAPTFGIAALLLCLCQASVLGRDFGEGRLRHRFSAFFLVLLALGSLATETRPHDSFMMGYIFAVLFFLSRPLSLGLALFALAGAADSITKNNPAGARLLSASRQTAFAGAILFLGGEIAGCYWGFMGWGTTWRWSGNFFYSAMIFVLFMVCLHLPRSWFPSVRAQTFGFCLPLTLIALAMTLSKVMMQ